MDSLKEKTQKGLLWGAINSGGTQVLTIVIGVFLARLLSPSDYGIIAMLTIFTTIATNIQDCGFLSAIVNRKDISSNDYNSVFWFNVIASIAMYFVLFLAAPFIADFFHQPVLVRLSRFVFLTFVIAALGIAQNAYLIKNLMVKERTIITLAAIVLSGICGVTLALKGYAYWSIAWQQMVYNLVIYIGRWRYCPWRPNFKIDFKPVKEMFPFSVNVLFTNIVNTVSNNILTFIFGRLYSAKVLGYFNQAYQWNTKANAFMISTLAQVAQPVLSEVNDDSDRQIRITRKMFRFTAFLSFPIMFGLCMVSKEFIVLLLSAKWLPSVPMLAVFCVGGAFMPFYEIYRNLVLSEGRSSWCLWANVAQLLILTGLILLLHSQSMMVMVIAYSAFNALWLLVWQVFANKLIGIRFIDVLKDVMPYMFAAAGVMALTYIMTSWIESYLLLILSRVFLAVVLYAGIMKICKVKMFDECLNFVLKRKK